MTLGKLSDPKILVLQLNFRTKRKEKKNYLLRGPKALDPKTSKSACKFSTASQIFSLGSPTTTWVFTFTYAQIQKT
jgi:hypothetical protein